MKTKRAYKIFTPLDFAFSLWADGGSSIQSYNADTHTFLPNREITPLTVRLGFDVTDKDGILGSGSKIPSVTDITWYEIKNGVRTLINATNPNYIIRRDGTQYNGSIQVVKNHISYGEAVTLEFNGKFLDSRNNEVLQLRGTHLLRTTASADSPLSLKLDSGRLVKYNPLEDSHLQKISAQLYLGSQMVKDAAKKKFWWYKVNSDGTEQIITGTNKMHIWYVSGAGSGALTINRENIYSKLHLRCKGEYISSTAASDPSESAVTYDVVISREYPLWEDELISPESLLSNQKTSDMSVLVTSGKGVISNPSKYFFLKYYVKPASPGAVFQEVGHGDNATYDATLIDSSAGKAVDMAYEIEPLTGYAALGNKKGAVFADSTGKILIAR